MCLNPTYIVHPTLKRIQNHCTFDRVRLEDVDLPFVSIKSFFDYPKKHQLPKNSDYVEQWYYVYSSTTGERHPLFFACPCGHCDDCLRSKYAELASRLQFEALSYPKECRIIFFTLTYSDKYLPEDGVSREDVTDFVNRIHMYGRRYGLPDGFRTFIVSEYGTDPRFSHRPHYHGLIFGLDLSTYGHIKLFTKVILKAWRHRGRLDWQFARSNHGVSRYCCKYVIKGLNEDFVPKCKNKNFISYPIKSGGLGVNALKNPEILQKILDSTDGTISTTSLTFGDNCVSQTIQRIRIPRFIIDKLFPSFSRFITSNIKRCLEWVSQMWNLFQNHFVTVGYKSLDKVQKKFSYLRTFVDSSIPDVKDLPLHELLERDMSDETRKKYFDFEKIIRNYNRIVEYLENYRYDCQYALSRLAERERYKRQICPENRHLDPLDSYARSHRLVSSCYADSALDAALCL